MAKPQPSDPFDPPALRLCDAIIKYLEGTKKSFRHDDLETLIMRFHATFQRECGVVVPIRDFELAVNLNAGIIKENHKISYQPKFEISAPSMFARS